MKVDTLRVSVEGAGVFVIPAFTRSWKDFEQVLSGHRASYEAQSDAAGCAYSIGDFALYLLAAAAAEPREMPGASDVGAPQVRKATTRTGRRS